MSIRYTSLQLSLLSIFLELRKGAEIPLSLLQQKVYRTALKKKPMRSRQSTAALIRGTSEKIAYVGAEIERTTGLGHGQHARYRLVGDVSALKKSLKGRI
jgi:hypothetical protein